MTALLAWLLVEAHAGPELAPSGPVEAGTCRCFTGQSRGNDLVTIRLRICRDERGVSGLFRWDGSESGVSERALSGELIDGGLRLRDEAILVDQPNPGWIFCKVDRYDLRWTEQGGLSGSYWSSACRDKAKMDLVPASDAVCRGPQPSS